MGTSFILWADDYALTKSVSIGILELARKRRISGTSAIVTGPHWPHDAPALIAKRDSLGLGLHLNLTLGAPLGPMPQLAPAGKFPTLRALTLAALRGHLPLAEIEAEFERQIERFVEHANILPDVIDGHQHVHALPGVRDALCNAVSKFWPAARPFIRDPADTPARIWRRGRAVPKALILAWLARGFGDQVRALGCTTNDSFAGVSSFSRHIDAVRIDFRQAQEAAGSLHMIMCHPGLIDSELEDLDSVTWRRQTESQALGGALPTIPVLWLPTRDANSHIIWPSASPTSQRHG